MARDTGTACANSRARTTDASPRDGETGACVRLGMGTGMNGQSEALSSLSLNPPSSLPSSPDAFSFSPLHAHDLAHTAALLALPVPFFSSFFYPIFLRLPFILSLIAIHSLPPPHINPYSPSAFSLARTFT
jgi:hypothetical protein